MRRVLLVVLTLLLLMFAEYRFIMCNIHPFYEDGLLCLEVFGVVDSYDIVP